MKTVAALAFTALFSILGAQARAQIAVSANDGKQTRPGDDPAGMRPDTIATIDLNQSPPKVLAKIEAPASMIGPPKAVVVAPDSSFAIVTCGQKPDPGNPGKLTLAGTVTVLDISHPQKPRIVQTATAGPGASGASINPGVNLALVANTSGSVSVFRIAHKKLTKAGDVQMEDGSGPTDVVFSRDGKKAYVVERGGNRISILNVDGTKVTRTGESFITGRMPYGMVITPDNYAVNTNLGGAMTPEQVAATEAARPRRRGFPRSGTITLVDLRTNKVVDSAVVGPTPEHVDLAPNGKYVEVTVANGAASSMTDPKYKTTHGLMLVYGVGEGKLTKLASVDTGHWCQGATWNKDSNEILLQCATERDIEVYKFDGSTLTPEPSETLHFNARPGAIATATNQ